MSLILQFLHQGNSESVIGLWFMTQDGVNEVRTMTDDQIGTLSVHWKAVSNLKEMAGKVTWLYLS